jgi:hypothetical protein
MVFREKSGLGEVDQFVSGLKAKARIEIEDPKYASLKEVYAKLAKAMPTFTPPQAPVEGAPVAPSPSAPTGGK